MSRYYGGGRSADEPEKEREAMSIDSIILP